MPGILSLYVLWEDFILNISCGEMRIYLLVTNGKRFLDGICRNDAYFKEVCS